MTGASPPSQYPHGQSSPSGQIAGDNSGDSTWPQQANYNQHHQYNLSSPILRMDTSLNYGEGLNQENFYSDTTHVDIFTNLNQMFEPALPPLPEFEDPLERTQALLNFEDLPSININRTNTMPPPPTQNWSASPYLYPIQTDVQPSPALSNASQLSDSSAGFLSPQASDPVTPSPTTLQGSYPDILSSPESPVRTLGSLSPALGVSFKNMHMSYDQNAGASGKSSNRTSLIYASSGPSSSTSEHFPILPTMGWTPNTHFPRERSASSNSGTRRPQSHPLPGPSSISAPPTPSTTLVEQPQHGTLTYTHAQQYQSWKETPSKSPIAGNIREFIPQRMYKPHTGSDRRRYVEQVPLSPPIIFEVDHPCEWGIDLDDALKCRTKRLVDRDALMFEGCGPSVSIRLEWPGVPWSRQIPTKDFRSPPGPITKSKLAKNIAKCVQRFIKDNADKSVNEEDGPDALRFKVGYSSHHIKLEDLVLVSLHHVSQGSWQPQLRLKRIIP